MNHVRLILKELKEKMSVFSYEIRNNITHEPPHELTQMLGKATLDQLNAIKCHYLWCAAYRINSGTSTFDLLPRGDVVNCQSVAEATLVRKMITQRSEYRANDKSGSSTQ